VYAEKWMGLEKQKKAKIEEVEQWYTKQKSELMKLHSTAMDQVRIKHVNEGL
jgi:hypothetical protein